jgi:hypothetical protein
MAYEIPNPRARALLPTRAVAIPNARPLHHVNFVVLVSIYKNYISFKTDRDQ